MTDQIDRYELLRELGRGGMATVYHARDPRFSRDVAIKVLPREFLHDQTFRERFSREAQSLAALDHSAIVPVYDYGEHEGQPYLAMRFMSGGSLADRIRQGPLSLDEAAKVFERIAAALDAAHAKGIVHRDVKPANVLFDAYGEAYLSDFGIVKLTEATAQLTGSGIIGTPAYMAPEMSEPGGLSPLVDVYALGVALFQALTGNLPYEADTPVGLLMAHLNKPVPDIRPLRSDLPPGLQSLITRAMAKSPLDRYQSAGEMIADLKALAAGDFVPRPAPEPTPAARPTPCEGTYATAAAPPSMPSMPPRPGPMVAVPPMSPLTPAGQKKPFPWLWVGAGGGALIALLACVAVVILFSSGVLSFPGSRGASTGGQAEPPAGIATTIPEPAIPLPDSPTPYIPPKDAPPPTLPPATPIPAPTSTPTIPVPRAYNIIFCDRPCDQAGAVQKSVFPEGTREIWVQWDYSGMLPGLSYYREWTNAGRMWIHFDCVWQGPQSGRWNLSLYDRNNDLTSGTWVLTIVVEGRVAGSASVEIAGNNDIWRPGGVYPCPDW